MVFFGGMGWGCIHSIKIIVVMLSFSHPALWIVMRHAYLLLSKCTHAAQLQFP